MGERERLGGFASNGFRLVFRGVAALALPAFLLFGVAHLRTWLAYPEEPQRTPIHEAKPGDWILVHNFALECETNHWSDRRKRSVGVLNQGGHRLALVGHKFRCDDVPGGLVVGVEALQPASFSDEGLPPEVVSQPTYLCTYCGGPSNEKGFALVGFAVALFCGYAIYESRRDRWEKGWEEIFAKADARDARRKAAGKTKWW